MSNKTKSAADIVQSIEKIFDEKMEGNLPDIKVLASNAKISPSTLKRHFHAIHNTSIYEYYLSKKMQYFRKLFVSKKITTVTEAAVRAGYGKTISFIDIYSRINHETPGKTIKRAWDLPPGEHACKVCGCTDKDCSACIRKTGKTCSWVSKDLCSACAN